MLGAASSAEDCGLPVSASAEGIGDEMICTSLSWSSTFSSSVTWKSEFSTAQQQFSE